MNGDEIRDTWFPRPRSWQNVPYWGPYLVWGYDASQVDDVLRRAAEELDAGRAAGPVIENARFRQILMGPRYDIDAVDWYMDQLLLRSSYVGRAEAAADPWHDFAVTQFTRISRTDPAGPRRDMRKYFSEECGNAWRDFGQQPGTRLQLQKAGSGRGELRTADQQTIASGKLSLETVTVHPGGRVFTWKRLGGRRSLGDLDLVSGLARRSGRDYAGHFDFVGTDDRAYRKAYKSAAAYVGETGVPVLYSHGENYKMRACASITFPDQQWLRFLVRGQRIKNAIMTAVDQAGNSVARYRFTGHTIEITVHPGRELTAELVLAMTISAGWIGRYFAFPQGSG